MNLRIEIRYAALISIVTLLWLVVEYWVGLHDRYIRFHPYVTLLALAIPVVCTILAVKEKINVADGELNFRQVFMTGFFIALFSAVFSIPCQLIFQKLINPGFCQTMIRYSVQRAATLGIDVIKAKSQAEMYFNLTSYLTQCFFGTLFFGTIIALIIAWRMRTVK